MAFELYSQNPTHQQGAIPASEEMEIKKADMNIC